MNCNIRSIVLDSCVWIEIWQKNAQARQFLSYISSHNFSLIIPEHVLNELSRKINQNKEKIIGWLLVQRPSELRLLHDNNSTKKIGTQLTSSFQFCHFPDNLILASCKENNAILVTYDKNLLLTADFEGVLACRPEKIRSYL